MEDAEDNKYHHFHQVQVRQLLSCCILNLESGVQPALLYFISCGNRGTWSKTTSNASNITSWKQPRDSMITPSICHPGISKKTMQVGIMTSRQQILSNTYCIGIGAIDQWLKYSKLPTARCAIPEQNHILICSRMFLWFDSAAIFFPRFHIPSPAGGSAFMMASIMEKAASSSKPSFKKTAANWFLSTVQRGDSELQYK